MKFSLSKWEDSFFGGYDRVVYDHPPITIPKEIKFELPDNFTVPFYIRKKIIELFLLKIESPNLTCEKYSIIIRSIKRIHRVL